MTRKIKTSIALDVDLLNWTNEMVKLKRFASTTHAVEYALQCLKEQENQELHIVVNPENVSRRELQANLAARTDF